MNLRSSFEAGADNLERVPGCFFFTGARNEVLDAIYPHHHPKFNIDEEAMIYAAKMLLGLAWEYLQISDNR